MLGPCTSSARLAGLYVLRAEGVRTACADPLCQPVSALLASTLIAREMARAPDEAAAHPEWSLQGQSAGHALREGFRKARAHLGVDIRWDDALMGSAAPRPKDIAGSGAVKAGTLNLGPRCQLETLASGCFPLGLS